MTPTINPEVYPSLYHVAVNAGGKYEIDFSDSILNLNSQGKLPIGTIMDNTNSYCGFDPKAKHISTTTSKYGYLHFNPDDVRQINLETKTYDKRINYRLMLTNSSSVYGAQCISRKIRYTNNISPLTTLADNVSYKMLCANNMATFRNTGVYSLPERNFPITKIDYDSLIVYPVFHIYEITFTYTGDRISGAGANNNYRRSYIDIKPVDKTAAGQYYDEDLWNNGFKDEFDADHKLIKRTIVARAYCQTYYGKQNRQAFNLANFSDSAWNYDGNRVIPNTNTYYGIVPMIEYVDEETNSVFYSDIPGLSFPRQDSYAYSVQQEAFNMVTGTWKSFGNTIGNTLMNNSSTFTEERVILDNDSNNPERSYTMLSTWCITKEADLSEITAYSWIPNEDGSIMNYNPSAGVFNIVCQAYPIKELMATIASLGLLIAADSNTAMYSNITTFTNNMYRGNMTEDGITDGTWVQGDDIEDVPKHADTEYKPFNPITPPGPPSHDYDEGNIGYNTNVPAGISAFTTNYILSAGALTVLGRDLWSKVADPDQGMIHNFFCVKPPTTPDPTTQATPGFELTLSNIIDYFISLKYFPFNLPSYVGTHASSPSHTIKIGSAREAVSTGAYNSLIADSNIVVLDGGSVTVPTRYNSFLDHEPYSSVSVYVPYCGTVSLQPSIIRGATLSLIYGVDLNTGGCQAILMKDGDGASFPVATINGTMGFNILLTGNNAQTVQANANNAYNSAVLQQQMNTASAFLDAGISTAMGNYGSAASAGVGTLLKNVNIAMNYANDKPQLLGTSPLTAGSSSIMASLISPQTAYVQIRYRIPDLDGFHLVGGIIDKAMVISGANGMGFVRIINPKLSGLHCTAEELNMIKEALAAGIWT